MNEIYKKLKDILKKNGVYYVRNGKGDHEIWGDGKRTFSIDKNGKSRHTANAALAFFGIKEKIL